MKILPVLLLLVSGPGVFSQEENWDVYLADYKGKPGSTVINMGLKGVAPLPAYPYVLVTGIKYKNCRDDGFPEADEFEHLYSISDSLDAFLAASFNMKKAGTFTNNCERLEYYYLADTNAVRNKLEKLFASRFADYESYINIKEDRDWKYYQEFLYPNETIREYMSNQKVLDALIKAGDKLEAARKVDHWAYFKTAMERDCFQANVQALGFTIEQSNKIKKDSMPFQLQFSRSDKVDLDAISKLTTDLKKKAGACHGEYDGWETFVIKE